MFLIYKMILWLYKAYNTQIMLNLGYINYVFNRENMILLSDKSYNRYINAVQFRIQYIFLILKYDWAMRHTTHTNRLKFKIHK